MSSQPLATGAHHPFLQVVADRDARRVAIGGLVGRFREAGVGLAIVLAVRAVEHSYAIAGVASAAYLIAAAITRPVHGRLVDRTSPAAGLIAPSLLNSTTLLILAAAVWQRASESLLLASAAAVGVTLPALSATLRALWPIVTPDIADDAYAFDTLLYEISLIASPALVGIIATQASPAIALLTLACVGTAGTLTVARSPAAYRRRPALDHPHQAPGLLAPSVVALIIIALLIGFAEGALTVLVPGFATAHHAASASGVLLSAFSAGSLIGALAYARLATRTTWPQRLAICSGALTLTLAAVAVFDNTPLIFGGLLALAGIAFAPTFTTSLIAIKEAAPPRALTEAFTWASFCASAGAAGAQALAGQLISGPGINTAVWQPALAAAITFLASTALLCRTHPARQRDGEPRGRRHGDDD